MGIFAHEQREHSRIPGGGSTSKKYTVLIFKDGRGGIMPIPGKKTVKRRNSEGRGFCLSRRAALWGKLCKEKGRIGLIP